MSFFPDYKHSYMGSKLEIDSNNKKILLKESAFGSKSIFDFDEIRTIATHAKSGSNLHYIKFVVNDLKKPEYSIAFFFQRSRDEWYSRVSVALSMTPV